MTSISSILKSALAMAIIAGCAFASTSSVAFADDVRLQGAGATFPQPFYERLVAEYQKINPTIKIDYQGIGSGGGIKGITDKTVDFAGSDAPLSKKQIEAAGGEENLIEVPSCAGGVVPAYNLPGIKEDLKFTGEILADIYLGKIAKWNDKRIADINPGVKLPDTAITPVWRTDGSGTSFVWTNFLASQSEAFKGSIGTGTAVKWPVGQGGKGNPGVTQVVQQTAGAIGYVEQNFANKNKIPFGLIKNKEGNFTKSTTATVSTAGENATSELKGQLLAANLWNLPGKESYPAASFTYLIVYKDLNNLKSKEQAQAMVDFLWWATHDGQKFATDLDYAPLAAGVQKKVEEALLKITYKGEAIKPAAAK